MNPTLF